MLEPSEGLVSSLCDNLKLIHKQLLDESVERSNQSVAFQKDEFWRKIVDVSRRISHEATKMCLSFSKPPYPSGDACEKLCRSLEIACVAFVSVFYSFSKQQGLTLRKQLRKTVIDVIQSVCGLVADIRDCKSKRNSAELQATGSVWEACEKVEKLPKDNKSAVLLVIYSHHELVKDALQELDHAIKESTEEPEEDGVKDDDEMELKWTSSEKDIVRAALGLVKTAHTCTKKTSEAILTKGSSTEFLRELDNVAVRIQSVSPAVDDFVSTLYPPMSRAVVMENAAEMATHLKTLLNSLKECHWYCPETDSTWWEFLCKAVDHNLTKVENLTGKSRLG